MILVITEKPSVAQSLGCLIYSLVKQSWNDCILLTLMASAVIAVYYVVGFISAEIDYLASLLMDFVHS